jgi:hypothetical protein
MENPEKINFHVERDFSELFNTAAKFFHQNFKHLFKCLTYIAGPFLLISSIFGAFYQSHALKFMPGNSGLDAWRYLSQQFGWEYFAFLICSIFSGLILLTAVYGYMLLYSQLGPGNFDVAELKALVWKNITKSLKGFLICMLIICGAIAGISVVAGLLIAIFRLFAVVLMILLAIAFFLSIPPFIWQYSTFYLPLLKDEDAGVSQSLRRVRELMRGEFFSTWLLVVASFILIMILSLVFTVPQLVYQIVMRLTTIPGDGSNTALFLIVTSICKFFSTMVYSVFYVICGLHYYSLSEKKEGTALLNRIDEIGNTPSDDVEQQY